MILPLIIKAAAKNDKERQAALAAYEQLRQQNLAEAARLGVPMRKGVSGYTDLEMVKDKSGHYVPKIKAVYAERNGLFPSLKTKIEHEITTAHELAEVRALRAGNILPTHTHAHPSVLLTESAIVNSLPPEHKKHNYNIRKEDIEMGLSWMFQPVLKSKDDDQVDEDYVPAYEKKVLEHFQDPAQVNERDILRAYKKTKGQGRSTIYNAYLGDMANNIIYEYRHKKPKKKGEDPGNYISFHDIMHPSLRLDIQKETPVIRQLWDATRPAGEKGKLPGAIIGGLSGAMLTTPISVSLFNDSKNPAILGLPLAATLLGVGLGANTGKSVARVIDMDERLDQQYFAYEPEKEKAKKKKDRSEQRQTKAAALNPNVTLRPHQAETVAALDKRRKAVVAHGTGLGKTLTSIAAFEKMRGEGKANKALIVVPSSLRENYIDNIKRFTNSSYNIFGAKNEKGTLNIDKPSNADYNIVSYDMFRKDPEGIKARTGADTLIIDEVHRARTDTSKTYGALSNLSPTYSNVFTLTGSIVNNEPSDVSPLLDVTFGAESNPFGGRKGFNERFLRKAKVKQQGTLSNTGTKPVLTNKRQLGKLLAGKVLYKSHEDLGAQMPPTVERTIKVPMTRTQKDLYKYTLDQLPPLTRNKIMHNIPVDQREMAGIFAKMMNARKVMTDPAVLSEPLQGKDPYEYSPKVRRVIDDLTAHLEESPKHKSVIYGNLVNAQLNAVRESLGRRNIPYSTFLGTGNPGNTPEERKQGLEAYRTGKNRVLLISGAGGEGLDLKGSSMMQLLEGHYNPEKIQQAEARVRRLGDKPEEPIQINKYVSYIKPNFFSRILGPPPPTSADEYIYTVAQRKDELNRQFRDILAQQNRKSLWQRLGLAK